MKWIRIPALLAVATLAVRAESLNILHLGPPRDIGFEVSAGRIHQKFTLSRLAGTGGFLIPSDQSATVETLGEPKVSLKLPPSKQSRIAVLHPDGESCVWRVCESKPTAGRLTLRLVNLTKEAANVTIGKQVLTIPPGAELPVDSPGKSLTLAGDEKSALPKNDEPSAVIAFLFKQDGKWKVHFFADT